jgi:thioredoxin-related protein
MMNTTQTVQWRHSLEDAEAEARQSGKLLLIELFSPKCGGCMAMERETFENPEIARFLEEHFVPVHYDVLADEEPMARFNTGWTPTVLVRDVEGREFRRSVGYLDPARFKAEMVLALFKAALDRRDFAAAHALADTTLEGTRGDALREPEALYWAGCRSLQVKRRPEPSHYGLEPPAG